MVMGDQGPLCGLSWPVCPDDLGQRLSSKAGTAWCPGCGRRWPLDEAEPCPWPGQVRLWDQQGGERVVCRSHAAHPSAARLVAIEEEDP
jgi:hypothetical protein